MTPHKQSVTHLVALLQCLRRADIHGALAEVVHVLTVAHALRRGHVVQQSQHDAHDGPRPPVPAPAMPTTAAAAAVSAAAAVRTNKSARSNAQTDACAHNAAAVPAAAAARAARKSLTHRYIFSPLQSRPHRSTASCATLESLTVPQSTTTRARAQRRDVRLSKTVKISRHHVVSARACV
jgi:hypothetical protein